MDLVLEGCLSFSSVQPESVLKLCNSGVNSRDRCHLETRDKESCSDFEMRAKQLRTISSGNKDNPLGGQTFSFFLRDNGSSSHGLFIIIHVLVVANLSPDKNGGREIDSAKRVMAEITSSERRNDKHRREVFGYK